jgi:hypothetical protein
VRSVVQLYPGPPFFRRPTRFLRLRCFASSQAVLAAKPCYVPRWDFRHPRRYGRHRHGSCPSPRAEPRTTPRRPQILVRWRHAPVAQLDRASGFEPEGREFESLRARHSNPHSDWDLSSNANRPFFRFSTSHRYHWLFLVGGNLKSRSEFFSDFLPKLHIVSELGVAIGHRLLRVA